MFTGIVDHTGRLLSIEEVEGTRRFSIETRFASFLTGESIAVDGICLTALDTQNVLRVDVSSETLRCTTAGDWKVGTALNLERALKLGDSMGGHWVSGHVDCVGRVDQLSAEQAGGTEFLKVRVDGIPDAFQKYLTPKGSIAVNGVSLTVNQVSKNAFEVMLIPHTLERTNLSRLAPGKEVNLEFDWMSKVIVNRVDELFKSREP